VIPHEAEQVAAADRAAMTAFCDMAPKQAARLLSFGVRLCVSSWLSAARQGVFRGEGQAEA
jgi:hypothetical protein